METSSKYSTKNKRKKRKQQSDGDISSVKPELFDGMSNWLKLQKVLEATAEESVPEKSSKPEEKRKLYKYTNNKKNFRKSDNKPQFKFDFEERRTTLLASQTEADSPRFRKVKPKQKSSKPTDSEQSDHNPENMNNKQLTKTLAIDCEMVGVGADGNDSIIARISIVNTNGECVYDEFVKPMEKVTDYRTSISGVRPEDLKKGKDLFEVQKDVLKIIEERRIVGHDLKHDFDVLFISHPRSLIRDTSKYKPFREISGGRTPSLKKLVAAILGCSIQGGEHSSIEDAQAAMLLYLKHKKDWEKSIKLVRRRRPAVKK